MHTHPSKSRAWSFSQLRACAIFFLALLAIYYFPYVQLAAYPLKLLWTWLHEFSHGIAAVLSGGEVSRLRVYTDASGLLKQVHPAHPFLHVFVASAGYVGTVLLGAYLLLSQRSVWWRRGLALVGISLVLVCSLGWGRHIQGWFFGVAMILAFSAVGFAAESSHSCRVALVSLGCFVLLSLLFVRDNFTLSILCGLGVLLLAGSFLLPPRWIARVYLFLSMMCLTHPAFSLSALFAKHQIAGGRTHGAADAHLVAQVLFFAPSFFWAFLWLALGLGLSGLLLANYYFLEHKQRR